MTVSKESLIVVNGTFEGKGATSLEDLAERFKIEVEPFDAFP